MKTKSKEKLIQRKQLFRFSQKELQQRLKELEKEIRKARSLADDMRWALNKLAEYKKHGITPPEFLGAGVSSIQLTESTHGNEEDRNPSYP